jgi:hypothetical protein
LFELPDVGEPKWVKDQAQIRDLESYLGPLQQVWPLVLPDEETNAETLRMRLNVITSAIDKALRSHIVAVPTGGMMYQAGSTGLTITEASLPLQLSVTPPRIDPKGK